MILKNRMFSVVLLAALGLAVSLFPPPAANVKGLPPPEALSAMDREAAGAALLGLPRQELLSAWGEPDGTLSGFFGDIYTLDNGGQVVVYYDTEPLNDGTGSVYTVPVQHIAIPEP